jgi:hypothetical protein
MLRRKRPCAQNLPAFGNNRFAEEPGPFFGSLALDAVILQSVVTPIR